jgi:hypothetical protein
MVRIASQCDVFGLQLGGAFRLLGVAKNAFYRANFHALRQRKMTHAFSAFGGRDVIKLGPSIDCTVWANRFANIAVDALVSDKKRHKVRAFDCFSGSATLAG